jgi:hypothetical protein
MKILADLEQENLIIENKAVFSITNNVRSYKTGGRKSHEVVRTIPGNYPYNPQHFPLGNWKITSVEWQDVYKFDFATYGPVKIRTDAWQMVKVWELDKDGDYLEETKIEVKDEGYLLHYSNSKTTLGCIRLYSPSEARIIANIIEGALKSGEKIDLQVI